MPTSPIGRAVETDLAMPLARATFPIGRVVETDLAGPIRVGGATAGTAQVESSQLSPSVKISDGLHLRERTFTFVPTLGTDAVQVARASQYGAPPPGVLEVAVAVVAICALIQTGCRLIEHAARFLEGLLAQLLVMIEP